MYRYKYLQYRPPKFIDICVQIENDSIIYVKCKDNGYKTHDLNKRVSQNRKGSRSKIQQTVYHYNLITI